MGLLEIFISNVFDIYPSQDFCNQFMIDKSLDVAKILNHDFLKLSLVYDQIWHALYKTYPTKRDFINFVNALKILPESSPTKFDKSLIEKILNTFFHAKIGLFKYLDTLTIFNTVQEHVANMTSNNKFIQDSLIKRWQHRFVSSKSIKSNNIFKIFIEMYTDYTPPNIYKYQINPILNTYNETVLFDKQDNKYLIEHEKIQYTIYKDNHMFMKFIDNIGIILDVQLPKHIVKALLNAIGTEKYINLINCEFSDIHDPYYCTHIDKIYIHMLPSVFSNYIYVSDKEYPEQKSLCINKTNAIYYLYNINCKNQENIEITKTYDRYVTNILDTDKIVNTSQIYKYSILDPITPIVQQYDILCGKKSYAAYKDDIEEIGYECTDDKNCNPRFIIDMYDEFTTEELIGYMANGSIPIVHKQFHSRLVKPYITGYHAVTSPVEILKTNEEIVTKNIKSNLKYFNILKDDLVFEHFWKTHMAQSCPRRTMNTKNGMLLYTNFVYQYFIKNIEKIVSIEDKTCRNQQYKVVLIDNRPNPLSIFSVLFTLSNLNVMWSCKVYTSYKAQQYYESKVGNIAEVVHYPELDIKKFHIDVYNSILKSSEFWKSTESSKTLIIQDDGILLKQGIERFMEFDYIGACWVDNVANEYIKNNITSELVGNGGFSLRNTDMMIKVCDTYIKEKNWLFYKNITQIPEDVYFVNGLKKLGNAKMPTFQDGMDFACEQVCNMKSIGLHKMWSYHMPEVTEKFFKYFLT